MVEAVRCGLSFLWVRIRPPKDQSTLEGYIVSNYGWRLYHHFFKTYNEKVWGVSGLGAVGRLGRPAHQGHVAVERRVGADPVVARAAAATRSKQVTSLIEEFQYPKYGPGMMWERCAEQVVELGGDGPDGRRRPPGSTSRAGAPWPSPRRRTAGRPSGSTCSHVISSMPFTALARVVDPPVPDEVLAAADDLHYRDFLTVALVVPEDRGFPDNWIYIHAPDVEVGRIQNFGSWSPFLVKDGRTCLGHGVLRLRGRRAVDHVRRRPGGAGHQGARRTSAWSTRPTSRPATWCGCPRPTRSTTTPTATTCEVIRRWFEEHAPNVHPVGRNGMHKYNNQDHSMYTAMLTVENIHGAHHDIWSVNVEEEYHEEVAADAPQG